jgi:hypothetical protein
MSISTPMARIQSAVEHVVKVLEGAKYADGSPFYATVRSQIAPKHRDIPDDVSFPCAVITPEYRYLDGVVVRSVIPWGRPSEVDKWKMKIRDALLSLYCMRGSFGYAQSGNDFYQEYFVYMSLGKAEALSQPTVINGCIFSFSKGADHE